MGQRLYWRMEKDGQLMGPTLGGYQKASEAVEEIKEVMGVDELPDGFCVVAPAEYRDSNFEKQRSEIDEITERNKKFLNSVLAEIPYEINIRHGGNISSKHGYLIDNVCCHHTVQLDKYRGGKKFNLDDPKQKADFIKEITKRIKDRERRSKKNKNIAGRTNHIGTYEHKTQFSIERASFSVYLDADQPLNEADVHVIGNVKFYKRSSKNVIFDVENRKIMTRDGKKEIKADNIDQIFDCLMKCLASGG